MTLQGRLVGFGGPHPGGLDTLAVLQTATLLTSFEFYRGLSCMESRLRCPTVIERAQGALLRAQSLDGSRANGSHSISSDFRLRCFATNPDLTSTQSVAVFDISSLTLRVRRINRLAARGGRLRTRAANVLKQGDGTGAVSQVSSN